MMATKKVLKGGNKITLQQDVVVGNVEAIGQIYETYDYSIFARLEDNRAVKAKRINKLIASISEKYILNPIIVNEYMEVIDGQGRYEALKALGKPIHFIISRGATSEDCRRMNKYNTKWTSLDFAESFAKTKPAYALLLKAIEETKLPISTVTRIANRGETAKYTAMFEGGGLVFGEKEYEKVIRVNRMCNEMREALALSERLNNAFRFSVGIIEEMEGYNHKTMLKKCKQERDTFVQTSRVGSQLAEFERIYNKRTRNENKIYFTDYMRNKGYQVRQYDGDKYARVHYDNEYLQKDKSTLD